MIVVTFAAKKQDFGDGWHDLIANVVPFGEAGTGDAEGPVRSAHAWLLPPQLARSLTGVSRSEPGKIARPNETIYLTTPL